jgi:hypothetical protein
MIKNQNMRKLSLKTICFLIALSSIILISSCDKPNLDGHWHIYHVRDSFETESYWDIKEDTLTYNGYWKISSDSFQISRKYIDIQWVYSKDHFKYKLEYDTCLLYRNDTLLLRLTKKYSCRLYEHWAPMLLDLNLPVFSGKEVDNFNEEDKTLRYSSIIYVGKPKDKSKKGFIQLNDMVANLSDLRKFIDYDWPLILIIDKNLELKYIDSLFFELRLNMVLRPKIATNISEDYNKLGLIRKPLPGIKEIKNYCPSYIQSNLPPLPPSRFSVFDKLKHKGLAFELNQDKLIYSGVEIDISNLKDTLQNYFNSHLEKNKNVNIFFEWDTASIFDSYAKVSVIFG